jgi:small subunit ribosomal protein S6
MRGFAPEQTKKERLSMALYEHVVLARQDISAQQVEGLVESFRTILQEHGGSVGKTEYWGLKSLTYRIKKNRKAHYSLMNIDAPHEAMAELERQERLSTDVIRFLTVRVDEHDAGPSAMMRRADRDERDGRGDRGDRGDRDRGDRGRGPRRDRDRDFTPREARAPSEPAAEEAAPAAEESSE